MAISKRAVSRTSLTVARPGLGRTSQFCSTVAISDEQNAVRAAIWAGMMSWRPRRQHDKSFGPIGALDDFSFKVRQDFRQRPVKVRPLIGSVGEQLLQERLRPGQAPQQQDATVAILDIGAVDDRVEQQTQPIYKDVALLALDLLARIVARRIDPGPPFSALFTLWLSMMAALGLAWRSSCSRHAT